MAKPTWRAVDGLKLAATASSLGNCVTPVELAPTPLGPSTSVSVGMQSRGTPTLKFSIPERVCNTTKFASSAGVISPTTWAASCSAVWWWCRLSEIQGH